VLLLLTSFLASFDDNGFDGSSLSPNESCKYNTGLLQSSIQFLVNIVLVETWYKLPNHLTDGMISALGYQL